MSVLCPKYKKDWAYLGIASPPEIPSSFCHCASMIRDNFKKPSKGCNLILIEDLTFYLFLEAICINWTTKY